MNFRSIFFLFLNEVVFVQVSLQRLQLSIRHSLSFLLHLLLVFLALSRHVPILLVNSSQAVFRVVKRVIDSLAFSFKWNWLFIERIVVADLSIYKREFIWGFWDGE